MDRFSALDATVAAHELGHKYVSLLNGQMYYTLPQLLYDWPKISSY